MLLPLPQVTPHPLSLIMESLAAITKWGRKSARVPLVSSLKVGLCFLLFIILVAVEILLSAFIGRRDFISATAVHHFFAFPSQPSLQPSLQL